MGHTFYYYTSNYTELTKIFKTHPNVPPPPPPSSSTVPAHYYSLMALPPTPLLRRLQLFFYFSPPPLALFSSLILLHHIHLTSNLLLSPPLLLEPTIGYSDIPYQGTSLSAQSPPFGVSDVPSPVWKEKAPPFPVNGREGAEGRQSAGSSGRLVSGGNNENLEVFHDKDTFFEDYKEMNSSFKIYVYPHSKDDPFAHAFLPVNFEPGGNYASESYFKKVLMQSHFITKDPSEADLFFLPFSIARLRHDQRIGVEGIPNFIRMYISHVSQTYTYWNRTGGADHFYVACHSIGRSAMEKANEVKFNAIQVVCSSSYFLSGYVAHKDASVPQIWPRKGTPSKIISSKRNKLAFFSGSVNSPVREKLLKAWRNDSEISVHFGRLLTSYSAALLGSKFCLHVKGFEVNTARIADAIYYGCVPVIIANHYDLPFADILDWKSFSVVVATLDIPLLKEILHKISFDQYLKLRNNVMKIRKHFQWNLVPKDYDAFYMVMYELWLRRSIVKVPLDSSSAFDQRDRNISTCL